jgi:hypothetical protein
MALTLASRERIYLPTPQSKDVLNFLMEPVFVSQHYHRYLKHLIKLLIGADPTRRTLRMAGPSDQISSDL